MQLILKKRGIIVQDSSHLHPPLALHAVLEPATATREAAYQIWLEEEAREDLHQVYTAYETWPIFYWVDCRTFPQELLPEPEDRREMFLTSR